MWIYFSHLLEMQYRDLLSKKFLIKKSVIMSRSGLWVLADNQRIRRFYITKIYRAYIMKAILLFDIFFIIRILYDGLCKVD